MEEAPENGKESLHSVHASGLIDKYKIRALLTSVMSSRTKSISLDAAHAYKHLRPSYMILEDLFPVVRVGVRCARRCCVLDWYCVVWYYMPQIDELLLVLLCI